MNRLLSLAFFFLILNNCSDSKLSENDFIRYVSDVKNGLRSTSERDGYLLDLTYRPVPLILTKNYEDSNLDERDSIGEQLSKYLYFSLKLSYQGGEVENKFVHDPTEYRKMIAHLSYEFGQNIYMLLPDNSKRIAIDYSYVRMFNIGACTNILVAFNKDDILKSDKFKIVIDDKKLSLGYHEFEYYSKKIKHIDSIKIIKL